MEITIKDKRTNYLKEGSGTTTIMFVHGWGGNINSLMGLHNLAKTQYTSVILDLPGFGSTDMPGENWGTNEYGEFLYEFTQKLDLTNIIYVGHSFGGGLGIYLAANYPNLISKLILIAPAFKRIRKTYNQVKNPLYKKMKKYLWPVRKAYYKIKYPGSEALLFPQLEENFAKIVSQDLTDLVPRIQQKTLVLWGTRDHLTPIQNLEILKEKLPTAEFEVYQDEGHAFPITKPEITYKEIQKFIGQDNVI